MSLANEFRQIGRRSFIKGGTLLLTANALPIDLANAATEKNNLCVGLITDLHYADKQPKGTRYYRQTLTKLEEAGERIKQANPDFIVELGDLIDAADSVTVEQKYLKTVNEKFALICDHRHYVLGNHCVDTLTKDEFLGGVQQEQSYYSFNQGSIHFVVLDSCFRSDGKPYGRNNSRWDDANLPEAELDWLKSDLQNNKLPVVVFAHQRLDISTDLGVRNNAEARKILEAAGNVLAVFQGHSHENDLVEIGGIHYCTLVAMVEGSGAENNGYSMLEISPAGTIQLTGFRNQQSRKWSLTTADVDKN